jgi:hypothetical protein
MGFLVGGAVLIGFWGGSVGMEQGIERVGRWCNGEAVVALPVVGTGVWWAFARYTKADRWVGGVGSRRLGAGRWGDSGGRGVIALDLVIAGAVFLLLFGCAFGVEVSDLDIPKLFLQLR